MDRNQGGMRLMDATLGAFTKYPCGAPQRQGRAATYIGRKKHGYKQSEADVFAALAGRLALPVLDGAAGAWQRHPLAYLVEAADAICYRVIDVEDGFRTGEQHIVEAGYLRPSRARPVNPSFLLPLSYPVPPKFAKTPKPGGHH